MRALLALFLLAASLAGAVLCGLITLAHLRHANDTALAARLAVVAQDVRETVQGRARLGVSLGYMADLQAIIERARASSAGLGRISVRGDGGVVLFSTDRVRVGDRRASPPPDEAATGWTRIGAKSVTVGVPVTNSFARLLGDIEVTAPRSSFDPLHLIQLNRLFAVGAGFLLLSAALAWIGSALLLDGVQQAVRAALTDARAALSHLAAPQTPPCAPLAAGGLGRLTQATARVQAMVSAASADLARLDGAEAG